MIRILSWNIQQGGGSRLAGILSAIQAMDAQVVVLSEYRNNQSGIQLRYRALSMGYRYQMVTPAQTNENSVILLSKFPADFRLHPKSDPKYGHSIVEGRFDAFSVLGMYLPHKKKHQLMDYLIDYLTPDDTPAILCGDMNIGINGVDQKGNSFWYEAELIKLHEMGYPDAFRHIHGDAREYSWYSHQGNGYRYDHTLVDKDLLPITKNCYYQHKYREQKLSDHSPMILELG